MPNIEEKINCADLLVKNLKSLGVEVIFAITGAGNLAIIDAIYRDGSINLVYSHHEQAAVMEAQGYARVTGKIGVALVTTGGGSSNVVTGILSAYLDSIPILLISGNESSFHCDNSRKLRAYGVQGFDSCAVLEPICKRTTRISSTSNVSKVVFESVKIALQGRQGPVHVDFPMDIQRKNVELIDDYSSSISVKVENVDYSLPDSLNKAIANSSRPIVYFGIGVRDPKTIKDAHNFIKQSKIPFIVSWSAIDLFPEDDPLNVGRVGIYGDRHANIILQKSDLVIAVGTRLAIPQIGYDPSDFGRLAEKWVIEIDPTECAKFEDFGWNVLNLDAQVFLHNICKKDFSDLNFREWQADCVRIKGALPRFEQLGPPTTDQNSQIHSGDVIDFLNKNLESDAIIATDVGAALLTGHYMYEQSGTRRLFTSQGLGEMGFGLPGSIGAYFADKSRQIVCLNTDGAVMFNLQELQVVKEHSIPLKLFIFNNLGYSMIKISQENLFDKRFSGSSVDSGVSFPEFSDIAQVFGFDYTCVRNKSNLTELIRPLKSDKPELIEIMMDPDQKYFPRLATNKLPDGTLVSPPLEDLDPKIELSQLENLLGYTPHLNSFKARGL